MHEQVTGWEHFVGDLTAAFGEDWVIDFCRTLTDEVRAEQEMLHASAQGRQARVAAATRAIDHAFCDGLGALHMRVDADVYFNWVQREGREIWNQPDFIRSFKRDNPNVRVETKSRKTMVVRP